MAKVYTWTFIDRVRVSFDHIVDIRDFHIEVFDPLSWRIFAIKIALIIQAVPPQRSILRGDCSIRELLLAYTQLDEAVLDGDCVFFRSDGVRLVEFHEVWVRRTKLGLLGCVSFHLDRMLTFGRMALLIVCEIQRRHARREPL